MLRIAENKTPFGTPEDCVVSTEDNEREMCSPRGRIGVDIAGETGDGRPRFTQSVGRIGNLIGEIETRLGPVMLDSEPKESESEERYRLSQVDRSMLELEEALRDLLNRISI